MKNFQKNIFQRYSTLNHQAGGSSGLLMDLAANEKDVHSDFYNGATIIKRKLNCSMHCLRFFTFFLFFIADFEDLFDEDEEAQM